MSAFGIEIENRRKAKGITQADAAERMGMSERHLRRLESGDVKKPGLHHLVALKRELDFTESEIKRFLSRSDYKICGPEFVESKLSGCYKTLARRVLEIDFSTIDNLTEEFSGTVEDRAPIFEKSPDSWRLLIHEGEIVGYWQLYCLQSEYFEKMRAGEMKDGEIVSHMIEPLAFRGHYQAYFNIIATKEGRHRGAEPVVLLLESVMECLWTLAQTGIFFSDVCADAFTDDGRRVCDLIGMAPETDNQNAPDGVEATIYSIRGADIKNGMLSRKKELVIEYEKEFG